MSDKQLFLAVVGGLLFTLTIVGNCEGQAGVGSQGFRQKAGETAENPAGQSPAQEDLNDATAFASIAEREIGQLDKPTTLGQWIALHRKDQRWVRSTQSYDLECLSYVKRDALPSGSILSLAVYFYPPQAPSPAVLPILSGQELMNSACTLAKVRVETEAPTVEIGHAITQAVQRRFTKTYGESVGSQQVAFWGRVITLMRLGGYTMLKSFPDMTLNPDSP